MVYPFSQRVIKADRDVSIAFNETNRKLNKAFEKFNNNDHNQQSYILLIIIIAIFLYFLLRNK